MVRGRKNLLHLDFSERLRSVRKVGGQTLAEIASQAGLAGNSVVLYLESGKRAARLNTVEKLAYALGVAPAYLAYGLDGHCSSPEALQAAGVGARLQQARLDRGLSVLALAKSASAYSEARGMKPGPTHTAVANIERGGTMPTIATVETLANALGLSPAWLAYGTGPQTLPSRRRSAASAPL